LLALASSDIQGGREREPKIGHFLSKPPFKISHPKGVHKSNFGGPEWIYKEGMGTNNFGPFPNGRIPKIGLLPWREEILGRTNGDNIWNLGGVWGPRIGTGESSSFKPQNFSQKGLFTQKGPTGWILEKGRVSQKGATWNNSISTL